jgi:hypothetical protein
VAFFDSCSKEEIVSLRSRLRTVLCCVVLEMGALTGVPMRPDEIRELMDTLAKPKLARTNPDRPDDGDPPGEPDDHGVSIRRGWRLLPLPGRFAAFAPPTRRWWHRWRMFSSTASKEAPR